MTMGKYLIVVSKLQKHVPKALQKFVRGAIEAKFKEFDVVFDFDGKQKRRDLEATFSDEIPFMTIFGVSTRVEINGEQGPGDSTIYVGTMMAYRLEVSEGTCEKAFPEKEEFLGSLIANTACHEIAHMLGLDNGGYDEGGHTLDPDNMMHSPKPGSGSAFRAFIYTVKRGDSLRAIIDSFKNGSLDKSKCARGPSTLIPELVLNFEPNKEPGFIRDPKKGKGIDVIHPGEKVALPTHTLRPKEYRTRNLPWLVGDKSFTTEQKDRMKQFIASRLKAGLG
jgi:hypothetical protein